MGHFWAVVLGVAQGIAEFLPISSTAHLKLIPWIFGIEGQYSFLADAHKATAFDIALHAGSFVAILAALWGDWVELVRSRIGWPAEVAACNFAIIFRLCHESTRGSFSPVAMKIAG